MKPILFSTPMVKALLNTKPNTWPAEPIDPSGPCKSQTRMVMKPQPTLESGKPDFWHWRDCMWANGGLGFPESGIADHAPYKVGDRLWVRESHVFANHGDPVYKADFRDKRGDYWASVASAPKEVKWRPSIHMPREAARLFLEVREVRAERLRDISPEDARAEGSYLDRCECLPRGNDKTPVEAAFSQKWCRVHGTEFRASWDAINAKKGCPWESDPWVWVCEFMRVEGQKHV